MKHAAIACALAMSGAACEKEGPLVRKDDHVAPRPSVSAAPSTVPSTMPSAVTPRLRRLPTSLGGDVTADAAHVYYVDSPTIGARIMAATNDLVTTREVAKLPYVASSIGVHLAVDATTVYWTTMSELRGMGPSVLTAATGGVHSKPIAGGPEVRLAAKLDQPLGLAQDEGHLYVSLLGSYPSYADGGVVKIPKSGGPLKVLSAGRRTASLTVHEGVVYFSADEAVWSVGVLGGIPAKIVAASGAHSLLVHGGALFFADSSGAVRSVTLTGGGARTLASGLHPTALVAVGPWLYVARATVVDGPTIARVSSAGGALQPLAWIKGNKRPYAAANATRFFFLDDANDAVVAFDLDR